MEGLGRHYMLLHERGVNLRLGPASKRALRGLFSSAKSLTVPRLFPEATPVNESQESDRHDDEEDNNIKQPEVSF